MAPKNLPEAMGGKAAAKAAVGSLIAVIGDEDTVTGMLLAGVGNVDARRTSNFMVVDSKTTPGQIEEAFIRFTKRTDVAVLLINQYLATQIRQTIDNFVRAISRPVLRNQFPPPPFSDPPISRACAFRRRRNRPPSSRFRARNTPTTPTRMPSTAARSFSLASATEELAILLAAPIGGCCILRRGMRWAVMRPDAALPTDRC